MRTFARCVLLSSSLCALIVLSACGGGGSSSSGGNGGGGNNSVANTVALTAGPGPSTVSPYLNGLFVSVTLCVPGSTSQCVTVPNVLVDTGSSGLRVLSSALGTVSLPSVKTGSNTLTGCVQYVDMSYNWGPIALADIKMGGEVASSAPIQIIADPASTFPAAPSDCSNGGTANNTLDTLSANGILGVSSFRYDCGSACAPGTTSNGGVYYTCSSTSCQVTTAELTSQLQNPVALFSTDNNGIAITLPTLQATGAVSVAGTLTFGIGTQSNNALGSATVLQEDNSGNFTTVFKGKSYNTSFIDSGSNAIFFLDTTTTGVPQCSVSTGFYCPSSTQSFSATNQGSNGKSSNVTISVANLDTLPGSNWVFNNVAGPSSFGGNSGGGLPDLYFDWGMPFFYGKTVFVSIEGKSTPAGTSLPFWAY